MISTRIFDTSQDLADAAATQAAAAMSRAIALRGQARILAGTGASQLQFLSALVARPDIDWTQVEMFHLDEYIGMPADHPASFRRYLLERLIRPTGMGRYHLLDGERDPDEVCERTGRELQAAPIDCAFVGIGENGHLAFNDPPADFTTRKPYIAVTLDERCRRQQVGEGWFRSVEEVPARAISVTVQQILDAREILCVVPDARKAEAVQRCLEGPVTPAAPASILQTHRNTTVYLDRASAALLSQPHTGTL